MNEFEQPTMLKAVAVIFLLLMFCAYVIVMDGFLMANRTIPGSMLASPRFTS